MTPPEAYPEKDLLLRMGEAAVEAVECMRLLAEKKRTVVTEVIDDAEFVQWEHYPPNDARDPDTHAQYYFHAHSPEDRDSPECGHFHTFLRREGMPDGIKPLAGQSRNDADSETPLDPLCHLVGISMAPEGLPIQLFTTNRWVTDETWYGAEDVIAMLDRFTFTIEEPSRPLNRWISAMMILFRPQIEDLIRARDRHIVAWRKANPDADPFEDQTLEILSAREISIDAQVRWIADFSD